MINVASLTPEMIDATTIQLKMVMENADGIPEGVRSTGKAFIEELDKWSTEMKAKKNGNG